MGTHFVIFSCFRFLAKAACSVLVMACLRLGTLAEESFGRATADPALLLLSADVFERPLSKLSAGNKKLVIPKIKTSSPARKFFIKNWRNVRKFLKTIFFIGKIFYFFPEKSDRRANILMLNLSFIFYHKKLIFKLRLENAPVVIKVANY